MAEVFAGFVVGYGLALLAAPAGAIVLVRSNDRSGFAQRVAPPGTNVVALSVVIHFAAIIVFTALGLVLGMALAGLNDRHPQDGLGSPNIIYTVMVLAVTAVLALPAVGALVFVVAFGWVLPWIATLG
jgi:hypothetical protein